MFENYKNQINITIVLQLLTNKNLTNIIWLYRGTAHRDQTEIKPQQKQRRKNMLKLKTVAGVHTHTHK